MLSAFISAFYFLLLNNNDLYFASLEYTTSNLMTIIFNADIQYIFTYLVFKQVLKVHSGIVFFSPTDSLLIDYQFTFSLLQEDDRHHTAINFIANPEQVRRSFNFYSVVISMDAMFLYVSLWLCLFSELSHCRAFVEKQILLGFSFHKT